MISPLWGHGCHNQHNQGHSWFQCAKCPHFAALREHCIGGDGQQTFTPFSVNVFTTGGIYFITDILHCMPYDLEEMRKRCYLSRHECLSDEAEESILWGKGFYPTSWDEILSTAALDVVEHSILEILHINASSWCYSAHVPYIFFNSLTTERCGSIFTNGFIKVILRIDILSKPCKMGLRWMALIISQYQLVQIMTWCRGGNKPLPERMLTQIYVTIRRIRSQWVKSKPFKTISIAASGIPKVKE